MNILEKFLKKVKKKSLFDEFLDDMADFLYSEGWYSQSIYIKECKTPDEVVKYIENHCCIDREDLKQLINRYLKYENKNN